MPTDTPNPASPRTATIVPDDRRLAFLPLLFGRHHIYMAESAVYAFMRWLSPADHDGDGWEFCEQAHTPMFVAPTARARYRIACPSNGFVGETSREAAGIIVTLFTFSHLPFHAPTRALITGYERLRDYAGGHEEARAILGAID